MECIEFYSVLPSIQIHVFLNPVPAECNLGCTVFAHSIGGDSDITATRKNGFNIGCVYVFVYISFY